jgi:hypothetical protein
MASSNSKSLSVIQSSLEVDKTVFDSIKEFVETNITTAPPRLQGAPGREWYQRFYIQLQEQFPSVFDYNISAERNAVKTKAIHSLVTVVQHNRSRRVTTPSVEPSNNELAPILTPSVYSATLRDVTPFPSPKKGNNPPNTPSIPASPNIKTTSSHPLPIDIAEWTISLHHILDTDRSCPLSMTLISSVLSKKNTKEASSESLSRATGIQSIDFQAWIEQVNKDLQEQEMPEIKDSKLYGINHAGQYRLLLQEHWFYSAIMLQVQAQECAKGPKEAIIYFFIEEKSGKLKLDLILDTVINI